MNLVNFFKINYNNKYFKNLQFTYKSALGRYICNYLLTVVVPMDLSKVFVGIPQDILKV